MTRSLRYRTVLAGVLLSAALAACDTFGGRERACPRVAVLANAERLVKFRPGDGRDLTDVLVTGRVQDVQFECEYEDDVLTVTMLLQMLVNRGPANRDRQAEFQYFIGVVKVLDGEQHVVNKQVYNVKMAFAENSRSALIEGDRSAKIKLDPEELGTSYSLLVGFQLSRKEFEFIQSQR